MKEEGGGHLPLHAAGRISLQYIFMEMEPRSKLERNFPSFMFDIRAFYGMGRPMNQKHSSRHPPVRKAQSLAPAHRIGISDFPSSLTGARVLGEVLVAEIGRPEKVLAAVQPRSEPSRPPPPVSQNKPMNLDLPGFGWISLDQL